MNPKEIKKILIIGNRLLGDSLITLHTLSSLKQFFSSSSFHLLTSTYTKKIYENTQLFKKTFTFNETKNYHHKQNISLKQKIKLLFALKKEQYKMVMIFPGGFGFALLCFALKIPIRIGHQSDGRSFLLTHKTPLNQKIPNYDNYKNLLNTLPFEIPYKKYKLPIKNSSSSSLILKKNYFVVAPCASEKNRAWNQKEMKTLCLKVSQKTKNEIVFLGLKEEKQQIETISKKLKGINLAGKTNFEELCSIINQSRFFLGMDTGLAYIAGNLNKKSMILYGPANPILSRPNETNILAIYKQDPKIPIHKRKKYPKKFDINQLTANDVFRIIVKKEFLSFLK